MQIRSMLESKYRRHCTSQKFTEWLLDEGIDYHVCDIMLRDGVDFPMYIGHDYERFIGRDDITYAFSFARLFDIACTGGAQKELEMMQCNTVLDIDVLSAIIIYLIKESKIDVDKVNKELGE